MRHVAQLRVAVLALALAAPARAQSRDPDPWLARDKAAHAAVSAGIAAGTYTLSAALLDARGHSLVLAAGITVAVGAGKETLDLAGTGDPSWKDFTWDVIGMTAGLAVAWSIDLLVRGVSDRHPLFGAPRAHTAWRPFVVSF